MQHVGIIRAFCLPGGIIATQCLGRQEKLLRCDLLEMVQYPSWHYGMVSIWNATLERNGLMKMPMFQEVGPSIYRANQ